ncbi:MAG: molybdopterin-guanine dinucleotide biosynthesis protein B [Acidilobaceae archaeon]
MREDLCIVQVVGPSGSGKTTSIVRALTLLKERGVRTGAIKHTHHEIDVAHKDSWRFLNEGLADYSIVVMDSGEKAAVFARGWGLQEVLEFLKDKVDVAIVEGSRDLELGPRIELGPPGPQDVSRVVLEIVERCLERKVSVSR